MKMQHNQNELLVELAENDEVMLIEGEHDLKRLLNKLKDKKFNFDNIEKKNHRSLLKLAGQTGVFESQFSDTVKQILERESKP